jgi:methylmalonyl-CoA mutase
MKESKLPESLFSEFQPVDKEQWKARAIEDLKGADYNKKLVWRTIDQFDVEPYYTKDENSTLDYLQDFIYRGDPDNGTPGPRHWLNVPKISDTGTDQATSAAVGLVENGADGVYFDLHDAENADVVALANGMAPLKCYTVYKAERRPLQSFAEALLHRSPHMHLGDRARGRINFDPIQIRTLTGAWDEPSLQLLKELITALKPYPRFHALTVSSSHIHDSGATASQEIAFLLNSMVDYLDLLTQRDVSAADVIDSMCFEVAVGTSYFMEIAKIKALRILCAKILEQYTGAPAAPERIFVHSISSTWSKTIFDPYVNMLRNTTEAMSAIVGGCNALTITPHDVRLSKRDASSSRITKNISIILKEESYFDKAADPAAGSYYIEQLTDKLVHGALDLFLDIEAQGGFIKAFHKGVVQDTLRTSREAKDRLLAGRRAVFVGTNKYPNTQEKIDPDAVEHRGVHRHAGADPELLTPRSGAEKIETVRLNTENWMKRSGMAERPTVYLSLVGQNAVMRSARATFSANFLGCAGFGIEHGAAYNDLDTAISKAVESGAEITVVCGADADYETSAATYAEKFRSGATSGLLLLAGNPGEQEENLRAAGFDGFIHMRADLIETLSTIQQKLHII